MDINEDAMSIFSSFSFQYCKNRKYSKTGITKMWHPGFAWGCTRKAFEKMESLFEYSIFGAGDSNIALSLTGNGNISVNERVSSDYLQGVLDYEEKVKNLRIGYVPGVIRHFFYGSKKNRRYVERWQILVRHKYSPKLHITKDSNGILIPTKYCPKELLDDIKNYFFQRNEDEM